MYDCSIPIWLDNEQYNFSYKALICNTLVTNRQFCNFLNLIHFNYVPNDSYYLFNCINTHNAIGYAQKTDSYYVKDGLDNNPVSGVNWYGALLFSYLCGGRLITEYEYENTVVEIDKSQANYGNIYGFTTPVKHFPPNSLGIYDSIGNLRVWCMDKYFPNIKYPCNKSGNFADSYSRVVKGNSWDKTEMHFNKKIHEGKWTRMGTMGIGIRVVYSNASINFS